MSMQRFISREKFEFSNGAIGWRPGGPFDCLGPYARVNNCPIAESDLRLTCYATGYADTHFSVPACTRYKGKYISGYFADFDNGGIKFHPMNKDKDKLPKTQTYKVLSIDSWKNSENSWYWNAWYNAGTIELLSLDDNRDVLRRMRDAGFLSEYSKGKIFIDDDQYNLVICNKNNREPIFAIVYGDKL